MLLRVQRCHQVTDMHEALLGIAALKDALYVGAARERQSIRQSMTVSAEGLMKMRGQPIITQRIESADGASSMT
jgi:hypothetical protein